MELRKQMARNLELPLESIPGFQFIGKIALLRLPWKKRISLKDRKRAALFILESLPNIITVCEISGIGGELRKPKVRFLAGARNFETVHRENGISYCLNVSKIMFSKGNLFERQRFIDQVKPGETVVDMFAGIGYFSLGISKFSKAERIISIEKNPVSFRYLKRNMAINRLENIAPVMGDCRTESRKKMYQGIADRILMGYLPKTSKFLPHAFHFAKQRCTIHYHDTFTENELWKKPRQILKTAGKKAGYKIKIISEKKVKSFAPKVWHVAIDMVAEKI